MPLYLNTDAHWPMIKGMEVGGEGQSLVTCPAIPAPCKMARYVSLIPLALIAIIASFYLFTIREGHQWGDDFGMYLLHAKSIVEGKGYAETPYLYNPLYPGMGPKAYPPVTSIALAPVYRWFGLNFTLMKITICAFFLAALWVLFWTYRIRLPNAYAAGLIILLGFNPFFWNFKDEILSDFPFLFFVWTTLYAVDRHYDGQKKDRFSGSLPYAILVGASMYLAYATRVLGVVLPAALCLYELIRFKRLSRFAVMAVLVTGILIAVQTILFSHVGSGYLSLFKSLTTRDIAKLFLDNVIEYSWIISAFLDNGHSKLVTRALLVLVSLLAALGLRRIIKDGVTILEVFLGLYLVALVVTPFTDDRYLFPIIPLYFFYAGIGAMELRSLVRGHVWQYAPIIVAGALILSYSSKYTTLDFGPIREGMQRKESKELFQYLRAHTHPDDIFIFRKPRALALLTDRRTAVYPRPSDNSSTWDGSAWNYFHDIHARYFIVGATAWARNRVLIKDISWERQFVARYKECFEEVFSNTDFTVYKIVLKGSLCDAFSQRASHAISL